MFCDDVRIVPHGVGIAQVHCAGKVRVESENFTGSSARLDVSENGNRLAFEADETQRVDVRHRDEQGHSRGVGSAQRVILFVAEKRMEVRGEAYHY